MSAITVSAATNDHRDAAERADRAEALQARDDLEAGLEPEREPLAEAREHERGLEQREPLAEAAARDEPDGVKASGGRPAERLPTLKSFALGAADFEPDAAFERFLQYAIDGIAAQPGAPA